MSMALRVLILEDEPLAAAQLERALHRWDPATRVVEVAPSTRRALEILRQRPELDVVLADIRLSDGLSLRVFDEVPPPCPVVFATAYDAYVIEALERNAIDYLLKPIESDRVAQAMNKYLRLREHFGGKLIALAHELVGGARDGRRVLARSGAAFVAVGVERIAWFKTEHKLTLLVDESGKRLLVDESLGELETRLGDAVFRLNRQYLARANGVASFRSAGRGRLLVTLAPASDDEVLVSQESAGSFRRWIAR
jgi:two-component system LytT family response regulator